MADAEFENGSELDIEKWSDTLRTVMKRERIIRYLVVVAAGWMVFIREYEIALVGLLLVIFGMLLSAILIFVKLWLESIRLLEAIRHNTVGIQTEMEQQRKGANSA